MSYFGRRIKYNIVFVLSSIQLNLFNNISEKSFVLLSLTNIALQIIKDS